jgi:predicted PurR-regulated permease PerM
MNQTNQSQNAAVTQAIEIAIRLGLIFLIIFLCLQILTPFVSIIVGGAIIAVAIYRPFLKLTEKLGGQKKLAATLISLGGAVIILVPAIILSGSLVESTTNLGTQITEGTWTIPAPSESVSSWPLIGEKVYTAWSAASANLEAFVGENSERISHIGLKLLGMAAGVGLGILQFIISLLIAGAFLASADSIYESMKRFTKRLVGEDGEKLLKLSTSTIRSVAVGVLGIALIQSIMAGLGMMLADVPAAGLIALFVLVFAIAQLPPLLVLAPVIFYVFSVASSTVATIFLVWCVVINFTDVVLKPLFLGRGVDAPMLVILLGAIGGMLLLGISGLFIGAIVLALGYKLLEVWLMMAEPESNVTSAE